MIMIDPHDCFCGPYVFNTIFYPFNSSLLNKSVHLYILQKTYETHLQKL